MNLIDWSKTLIRCSALGNIMTEPRSKSEALSQTCKTYLRQLYREKKYNRRKDIKSKYLEKGLNVEEDSITLYSRFKHKMFKKNELRLTDEFFSGEPDTYEGAAIQTATRIIDTKSSWDLFTLPFPDDEVDKGYKCQANGYMALTGANEATIAHCLVNTPAHFIQKEIDSIRWQTGVEATDEQIAKIKHNMIFDDIPINERVIEFHIQRDDALIEQMKQRIILCREYLTKLL